VDFTGHLVYFTICVVDFTWTSSIFYYLCGGLYLDI